MAERALNVFWIVFGVAAAVYARQLGLTGPSGPESGLFPFISGLIIAGAGLVLLLRPSAAATMPEWPRGPALGRVAGVAGGLALMAALAQPLGFALASAITMIVLLRVIERSNWFGTLALALGSVAVVVWLFGHVLGMPLPRGPWGW